MCKKLISLLLSLTILLGAVWVPVGATAGTTPTPKITLILNTNGGEFTPDISNGIYPDRRSISIEKDKNGFFTYKSLSDSERRISREYYDFAGWYTTQSTTGGNLAKDYHIITNAKDGDEINLYARWTRKTKPVTLDCKGGAIGGKEDVIVQIPYGSTYASVLSSNNTYKPSRDGYSFNFWASSTLSTKEFDLNTIVTGKSSEPSKLVANWTENGYTVTLDPNGGDAITDNQFSIKASQTYQDAGGTKLTTVPKRTGYIFDDYWYTASSGGNQLDPTKTYSELKVTRLYAHWTPKTYDLSFDYAFPTGAAWKGQDDSFTTNQPNSPSTPNKVTYDSRYPALPTPAPNEIPYYETNSQDKYTFDGWYDLKEATVDLSTPSNSQTGKKITGGANGDLYQTDKAPTLYARWGYKLKFFANNTDDVSTESPYHTMDCVTGSAYSMSSMPKTDPVKPGYTFAGWFDKPGDTGTEVQLSASDIADGSIKELYAHWTAAEYKVTFDATDGELDGKTTTVTVTFGGTYPTLATTKKRTGYDFAGWYTKDDKKVEAGDKVETAGDHILYAHWTPLKLTLNFNYNFPDGITQDTTTHPSITPTKATYGAPYDRALPVSNPPSVTNDDKSVTYSFDGWYTTKEDKNPGSDGTGGVTGQRVQSSMPVELEYDTSNSATLFARWKYKVNFYANIDPNAASQTPISGINFSAVSGSRYGKLPGEPSGNPSKYFLGWFTSPTGGVEIKDISIANGTDVKLYAHWGDTRVCKITLNGNGVELPAGYPTSEVIEYGQDHSKLLDRISAPPRDGYTFLGWYLNPEGTGSAVTSKSIVTGDCTLYAKWKINAFKVTFNMNYGSSSTVKSVDYNTKLSDALPSPEPERSGYAFDGWYTDSKCETPADTNTLVTADITLYAKWVKAQRVTLVLNGGTLPSGVPAYINVYEGGTYDKLRDPTWTGCTFRGWFDKESGGTQVKRSDKVPATASIPATLYAQWDPLDVTVTFDPNGAVNQTARSRTYKVGATYGTSLSNLLWSGHKFMGWYTQKTGGSKVEPSTVITVKSDKELEITLYAHWGYEVFFDPTDGGGSMDSQIAEMDQPFTLPVSTFTPPTGMRFGGWAPGAPNAATTYPGGSQYTVNRQVTFYATWTTAPIVITATSTSGGSLRTDDGKTNEITVERGQDVTFVTQPNSGYELKELIVDGTSWNYVDVHTFKNVTENHTIHAVFVPVGSPSYSSCDHGSSCPLSNYSDLNAGKWYHDAVHYCVDNVIMGGTGSKFYPSRNTTRAELAVSLYNYAGRPSVNGRALLPNTYTDVRPGDWHYQAIAWATKEGILAGYGNGKFKPNQSVTREQLVAILWRHAGEPEPRSTTLRFFDSSKVSDYAWEAMCWGTEQGILQGRSNGYLVPKGTATRAEVAEMLKNYLGK